MTSAPIVVVTGANRGIGFEISRQLATRGAQVVLTARKPGAGKAAVKKLAAQNLTVQVQPLDVTSEKSIIALREFLKRTYGRLNVLINNAGIIAKSDASGLKVNMETVRVPGRHLKPTAYAGATEFPMDSESLPSKACVCCWRR